MPRLPPIVSTTFAAIALMFCIAAFATDAPATTAPDWPAGHWQGSVALSGAPLNIKIDLEQSNGTWRGFISFPWSAAQALPLDNIQIDADRARFAIAGVSDAPTFDGRLTDGAIIGAYRQGDLSAKFRLDRGSAPATQPALPREPTPPFPYTEKKISFAAGSVTIAGILTLPPGPGPLPAAVLINGSGRTDRDETSFGHRIFLVIADGLTRAGVAVLRCDKRGVGASTGSTDTATIADRADDTLAAVAFLKSVPQIDPKRIGLIGHSEGALVAPIAADRSTDVAFVVLLSGPGVPIPDLLIRQQYLVAKAAGGDEPTLRDLDAKTRAVFALILSNADQSAISAAVRQTIDIENNLRPPARRLQPQFATVARTYQLTTPAFRSFLACDPSIALQKLRQPILILAGDKDLQVPPAQNLPAIQQFLKQSGNPDVTIDLLPGLNHLFQRAATGSPDEYQSNPDTFNDAALNKITDWITHRFPPRPLR